MERIKLFYLPADFSIEIFHPCYIQFGLEPVYLLVKAPD